MPKKYTNLRWPILGVSKRLALQYQAPYTTPDAMNVRGDDSLTGRERGGSRPGLVKAYAEQISGASNPVRLVADVTYVSGGLPVVKLVASANGVLYYDASGTMTAVGGTPPTLASGRQLCAAEHLQKLYITSSSSGGNICVFNPVANTLAAISATAGTAPTGKTIIARFRDRLVVAGDGTGDWFMSRQGVPTDWDYGADDSEACAVAASNSDAGSVAEPITALIPHTNQCLIFGAVNSVWILTGDPNSGGRISRLSDAVGIISQGAWCYDSEGYLWFLSLDGLYMMPPGCGDTPISVSRERLPEDLQNINRTTHTVNMAYDARHRGIHIFVSKNTAGATSHYWIDTKITLTGDSANRTVAFWPQSFQSDHEPFAILARRDTPQTSPLSPVLLGGRDGYVRQFSTLAAQDDGSNAITSYCDIGPIPLAPPGSEGRLDEVQVVTASASGDLDLAVRVGKTAQEAVAASAFETYEMNTAGLNATVRPRARGQSAVLRVSNGESNAAWSLEDISVLRSIAGTRRV